MRECTTDESILMGELSSRIIKDVMLMANGEKNNASRN